MKDFTHVINQQVLTDQEVWLRVYCASLSITGSSIDAGDNARLGLHKFHNKFPKQETVH